jgi:hemoglobin/transferrin/lactoferrin receptor protein
MRGLWGTTAAAALLGLMAGSPAQAEDIETTEGQEITVTATRTEEDVSRVPSVVTVITDEEIEENLVTDIKELVRFEPNISVQSTPSRFGLALGTGGRSGNSGFNIRGLDGNRVLLQIDGIRVPDAYEFGPASFGRGDYVDLDLLQSVEILRGPGSALYGSDGLAGVVSFITKDPSDFLYDGESFAGRVRVGYASVDESFTESLTLAGRSGAWSVLAGYTRRDGSEYDNQGENEEENTRRTAPNPAEYESNAALARLVFQPSDAHRFRFTADYNDRYNFTEVLSARALPPLAASSILDLNGFDENERTRYALDYAYEGEGFINRAFAAVYSQDSFSRQFADENRNTSADRTRDTSFENEVWGAALQLESGFDDGGIVHRFVYGFDYSFSEQSSIRTGILPTAPETFPTRSMPITEYERLGVFLMDEITLLDGVVTLYPAVRYDSYELNPIDDALYPFDDPEEFGQQSDDHISPKFGIVVWPTETFGFFANYAAGFKTPAPSEVNNFFENPAPAFGNPYTTIPNPDLGPETSDAFDLGLRWRNLPALGGLWNAQLTGYVAEYEDFIARVVVDTFPPEDVNQFVNLNSVSVNGIEARADGSWDNGFGFTIATAFSEGDQSVAGVSGPLESIEPWRVVTGVSWDDPNGRFGGQAIVTYASQKDEEDTTQTFRPDAFTILDLTGYWNITDAAVLRVGVFNVTDETYWLWSDVRGTGLTPASISRDAFTQAGRNVSASIAYRF